MLLSKNWNQLILPGLRFVYHQAIDRHPSKIADIFSVQTSSMSKETAAGVGALPTDDWDFEETGKIQYDTIKAGFDAEWVHREFAKGLIVERKFLDDNLYGAQSRLPKSITDKVEAIADATFIRRENGAAEVFNNATSSSGVSEQGFPVAGPDGVAFASASHPLSPGSSSVQSNLHALALSATNYDTVRVAMRKLTDDNGNIVAVQPDTLIVPPELETAALTIMESQNAPGTANNDANVVGRRIKKLIVWDYLTDTNRWFVGDSALMSRNLVWFDRIKPEFNAESDFDTLKAKYSVYMRYTRGVLDWRCISASEPS